VEGQLSDVHRNLAKIKSSITETKRILSEFAESMRMQFKERVLPQVSETIQQMQSAISETASREVTSAYSMHGLEELKKEIERAKNLLFQATESFKDKLLQKLEDFLILGVDKEWLEKQKRDLEEIKSCLKSKGLRSIRVECPHPREFAHAMDILGRVLGRETPRDLFNSRTGFNSYVICLDCLHQFEADFRDEKVNEWRFSYERPSFKEAFRGKITMKDERKCPKCGSRNVRTVFEMIGKKCPKCKEGTIEEIETGLMT
jgi:ribosomal protein S27AE